MTSTQAGRTSGREVERHACPRLGGLLACDAKWSPRHSLEALGINWLFATQAFSKRARIEARQRRPYFAQLTGVAFETAHDKVVIAGLLDAVEIIRAGID